MIYRFFFFKQKTAYEMRISDWSSDVCSSDLETDQKPAPDANISAIALDTGQAPPVIGVAPPMQAAAAPADEPSSPQPVQAVRTEIAAEDRKSVVQGKRVSVPVANGARRILQKNKTLDRSPALIDRRVQFHNN